MRRKILLIGVLIGAMHLWLGGALALAAGDTKDLDAFTKEAQEAAKRAAEKKAPAAKPAAKAAATVAKAAEPKKEEEEKPEKWWNLAFGYSLSHNIDASRPTVGNSVFVEPTFVLPYKIRLMAHLGMGVNTTYVSPKHKNDGGQNVTINSVDMDPILISLSRSFKIDPKYTGFAVSVKLDQMIPAVSKYVGLKDDYYYAIKPGVGASLSRWGVTLSNSFAFQKNVHGSPYAEHIGDDGGPTRTPLNSFSISDMTALRYKFWKMEAGIGAGYIVGWRYNWSQQGNRIGTVKYTADVGIDALDSLNISLSADTSGPERYNAGFQSDHLAPFKAQFTQFALTIVYSL